MAWAKLKQNLFYWITGINDDDLIKHFHMKDVEEVLKQANRFPTDPNKLNNAFQIKLGLFGPQSSQKRSAVILKVDTGDETGPLKVQDINGRISAFPVSTDEGRERNLQSF